MSTTKKFKAKRGDLMKLTIFDRRKYQEAIKRLKAKNAPDYIIEAYQEGYGNVVNAYYKKKLERRLSRNFKISLTESKRYKAMAEHVDLKFLKEALTKSDIDFLKAFFQVTNLDIFTGEKLPPNAGELIKQGTSLRGKQLKDLYKKLK